MFPDCRRPQRAQGWTRGAWRRAGRSLTVCLLVGAALPPLAEAQGSSEVERQLADGEIVITVQEGGGIPPVLTEAIVDAPPAQVFALIDDCNAYPSFIPRVVTASEFERNGHRSVCSMRIDMPAPMDDRTSKMVILRTVTPGRWYRTFQHVEGEFIHNDGFWLLQPYGEGGQRTRVTYRLHSAFKTSLPDAVIRVSQRSAMRDLMRNLRKRVERPRAQEGR